MFKKLTNIMLLLAAILMAACDDNYVSSIPNYPVRLQVRLTAEYSTFKNSTNQFLLFEARKLETDRIGYGGIMIYSGLMTDDYGNSVYYAFDMACPYEAKQDVKVYPVQDSLPGLVRCEKCGSEFNVAYGFGDPVKGPATEILKRYRVTYSSDVLIVQPR